MSKKLPYSPDELLKSLNFLIDFLWDLRINAVFHRDKRLLEKIDVVEAQLSRLFRIIAEAKKKHEREEISGKS